MTGVAVATETLYEGRKLDHTTMPIDDWPIQEENETHSEYYTGVPGHEILDYDVEETLTTGTDTEETEFLVTNFIEKNGGCFVNCIAARDLVTDELKWVKIKDLIYEGDLSREQILNFFDTFEGYYNTKVEMDGEYDRNVRLRVHFD